VREGNYQIGSSVYSSTPSTITSHHKSINISFHSDWWELNQITYDLYQTICRSQHITAPCRAIRSMPYWPQISFFFGCFYTWKHLQVNNKKHFYWSYKIYFVIWRNIRQTDVRRYLDIFRFTKRQATKKVPKITFFLRVWQDHKQSNHSFNQRAIMKQLLIVRLSLWRVRSGYVPCFLLQLWLMCLSN